jgi:hypothetical protein
MESMRLKQEAQKQRNNRVKVTAPAVETNESTSTTVEQAANMN